MMYPSFLHLPGIAGVITGYLLGEWLWRVNPVIGVLMGIVCVGLGLWGSLVWSKAFFKEIDKG